MKSKKSPDLAFFLWFGQTDLLDPRTKKITGSIFLNQLLFFILTILLLAVPQSVELIRKNHLIKNPMALAIEFDKGAMREITANEKEKYEAEVANNKQFGFGSVSFYRQEKLEFDLTKTRVEFSGRTVQKNDPVVDAIHVNTQDIGDDWIAVSSTIKEQIQAAIKGNEISIFNPITSEPDVLKIAGYYSSAFDSSGYFMISETAISRLKAKPNPKSAWVVSGPLPFTWKTKLLPEKLESYVEKYNLKSPREVFQTIQGKEEKCWRLATNEPSGMKISDWNFHVFNLENFMNEKYGKGESRFSVLSDYDKSLPGIVLEKNGRTSYDVGVLYMEDLDFLSMGIRTIKKLGSRPLNPEIEAQFKEIQNSTEYNRKFLLFVIIAFAVISVINGSFLEYLRLGQKTPDVGLLKSIGVNDSQLRWIYLVETWMVYLAALITSLAVGMAIVGFMKPWLVPEARWDQIIDKNYVVSICTFLIISIIVATISVVIYTQNMRNNCPADSLCKSG